MRFTRIQIAIFFSDLTIYCSTENHPKTQYLKNTPESMGQLGDSVDVNQNQLIFTGFVHSLPSPGWSAGIQWVQHDNSNKMGNWLTGNWGDGSDWSCLFYHAAGVEVIYIATAKHVVLLSPMLRTNTQLSCCIFFFGKTSDKASPE